jgi:hypothetical protein
VKYLLLWPGGRYEAADETDARAIATRLRNALGPNALIAIMTVPDRSTMKGRTTRSELDQVIGP